MNIHNSQSEIQENQKTVVSKSDTKLETKEKINRIVEHCKAFQGGEAKHSLFQIANTIIPFLLVFSLMVWLAQSSIFLPLLLSPLAGALLVRLFIIQHDCGHGSYFNSEKLNTLVGRLMSVFTHTPYAFWRRAHAIHHATSGNLDKRGVGDIDTVTVNEYKAMRPMQKLRYRLYRNPIILLIIGVPLLFALFQRLPWGHPLPASQIWRSIIGLNLMLAVVYGLLFLLLGPTVVALTVLPTVIVGAWIGGWLFYIQHQFENTHWDKQDDWNWSEAAIMGSSFYDLPKILHWFTGNIGLHHIHHVCSRIPNYKLQACMDSCPELKNLNRITLLESFKYMNYALWDEEKRKLIRFRDLKTA